MRDLAQLQDDMTRAILGGEHSAVAGDLTHAGRFSIYRNNSYISLTEALKATFPVTVKMTDERFFSFAAHRFITAHPPREARLAAYGGEFPRFLVRFEPCRNFPFVAEMTRLEWAIAEALNAQEERPLAAAQLSSLTSATDLRLQPSLRFVVSRYPLLDLWSSHQAEVPETPTPLRRKPSRIIVHRRGDDIHFAELEPARFAFMRSLARGMSLEDAAWRALQRDPMFDLAGEIVTMVRAGLAIGFTTQPSYH